MLKLTDEQKSLFFNPSYYKEYKFYFPEINLTLDNDSIAEEKVKIIESVMDGQELELGGCIASSIEFLILDSVEDITGLLFYATLGIQGTNVSIPMGTFRVDSATTENDSEYKKVMAYDVLYDASVDVSKWYESLFATQTEITLKAFRESLLFHLGIPYIKQTLPNDSIKISKTLESQSGLSGMILLRMICTINGGFGRINRNGYFVISTTGVVGLYPEETLFPSEDLYPEDSIEFIGSSEDSYHAEWYSATFEEFTTLPITNVAIQTEGSDLSISSESDTSNTYLIVGNYLLYDKKEAELKAIGHAIFEAIKSIQYKPCKVTLDAIPYLEVGDNFNLTKEGSNVETFMFSRTLTGIQGMKDEYETRGNYVKANEVSVNQEIQLLKGKTLRIDKTIDGISTEVSNFETQTSTRFEQTDSYIVLKVDANGNMAIVELSGDAKDGTRFIVSANNISLTADQTISLMSGGNLDLDGKNITISSEQFSVDSAGNAYFGGQLNAASGTFKGTLSGASGTFSGNLSAAGGSFNGELKGASGTFSGDLSAAGGTFNGTLSGADGTFSGSLSAVNGNIVLSSLSGFLPFPYIQVKGIVSAWSVQAGDVSTGGTNEDLKLQSSNYCVIVGHGGYFRPEYNDEMGLGSPNYKWTQLYAMTSTISTSDINEKKNIEEISDEYAKNIVEGLNPTSYQFINGKSGRTHNGLIAQDVEELLNQLGIDSKDFAALCISEDENGNKSYGLRYEEFIAPIIKYCQILKKENDSLNDRLTKLEREVFKN